MAETNGQQIPEESANVSPATESDAGSPEKIIPGVIGIRLKRTLQLPRHRRLPTPPEEPDKGKSLG